MRRICGLTIMCMLLTVTGASAFSREALDQVDQSVTFVELQQNPEGFIGRDLLLGGVIISLDQRRDGGMQMEVAQLPLAATGRPVSGFNADGRFLVTIPDDLDRNEYRPGMKVAVIGAVKKGVRVVVDGEESLYPVLAVKEMELWPASVAERRAPPRDVVVYEREPEAVYVYDYPEPYYRPYYYWPYYPLWFGASFSFRDYPSHHYRSYGGGHTWGRHDGPPHRGGGSAPAQPPRRR